METQTHTIKCTYTEIKPTVKTERELVLYVHKNGPKQNRGPIVGVLVAVSIDCSFGDQIYAIGWSRQHANDKFRNQFDKERGKAIAFGRANDSENVYSTEDLPESFREPLFRFVKRISKMFNNQLPDNIEFSDTELSEHFPEFLNEDSGINFDEILEDELTIRRIEFKSVGFEG